MIMTDFSEKFMKSKGEPITYNDQTLHLSHKFPVKDGDVLLISIEKATSDCRQGVCIDISGSCEMDGKTYSEGKGVRMQFWADTSPAEIKLKIHTKRDFVWVENIWEKTSLQVAASPTGEKVAKEAKHVESRYYGSAMVIEPIEGGIRYRCNDWHPDATFDDIVFTVRNKKDISGV